jgi:hypothetical protein
MSGSRLIGNGPRYRSTQRTSHWLLPGALRHVVQVHMTGDDWQSLPAQQLTSQAASVPQWIERMLRAYEVGVNHVPSSFNAVLHQGHSPPSFLDRSRKPGTEDVDTSIQAAQLCIPEI